MKAHALQDIPHLLEQLEDRIAPAAATFIDVDGDMVKVTTTKGTDAELQALVDTAVGGDPTMASQMEVLALTANFAGTSIKIAVSAKASGGDGLVNVWAIDATGLDLGKVEVNGDLAKLTVGDANPANGSVKSVLVQSIGVNGGAAAKDWMMLGGTSSFSVAGDVAGATLAWVNDVPGGNIAVGKVFIGGNLIGGTTDGTGLVTVRGGDNSEGNAGIAEIKSLTIGGNLVSTAYHKSGAVIVGSDTMPDIYKGKIGKVTVGGNLQGFAAKEYSGTIFTSTGSIGDVTVGGSLEGGGFRSGSIISYQGTLGAVNVGGSLDGGAGQQSGAVIADFAMKSATIGGSLEGAGGALSGAVRSNFGKIGPVSILGNVEGGGGVQSGAVYGNQGLGKVSVGGSIYGGTNDESGVIATGLNSGAAIGDVFVGGGIFGGSDFVTGVIQSDYLGKVTVGGSLEAGTQAVTGMIFATENAKSISIGQDVVGGASNSSGLIRVPGSAANIASIFVGGDLVGAGGTASGSIEVGGKVGSVKIGGNVLGGNGVDSASISVEGTIGSFFIGKNVIGGQGAGSAGVEVGGKIGNLTVGGGIAGSGTAGENSARFILNDVGSVTIGGSIIGGAGDHSGKIQMQKGSKMILGGGIVGGGGEFSGQLSYSYLAALSVGIDKDSGVSLLGGSNSRAGMLSGSVGKLTLAGDVVGGSSFYSGSIFIGGTASDVFVGGDVKGGSVINSGFVYVSELKGKLTVGGDVVGMDDLSNNGYVSVNRGKAIEIKGSIVGGSGITKSIQNSGYVTCLYSIDSLTIGGSIIAGQAFNANDLNLGAVRAGVIGAMVVKGDIVGNASQYVTISGKGDVTKTSGTNLAIKSLTVHGSVTYANILGGYTSDSTTLNGNGGDDGGTAQLGVITVMGDFVNSSIATGVSNASATKNHWADGNNFLLGKPSSIVASIAKIVIKGATFGGVQNGIAAEQIKSLNLGGFQVPVPAGAQHFQVSQGNFFVQQVV